MQHPEDTREGLQRRKARFVRALARSTDSLLNELEAADGRPAAMAQFLETLRQAFSIGDDADGKMLHPGKKVIGTYCIMTPEEFIYAVDAVPVRLCGGSYEASLAGDELVPRDICPVVRAAAGYTSFGLLPIYERCDAVIVPTTCDGKRKLGEALSDFLPVWMLEVPHIKDAERSRLEWLEQIYAVKRNIEKLTRKKIKRKALGEAIRRIARAQYQARRLHELRAADPPIVLGQHAMLALNAYAYDTVDRWAGAMARLNDELEQHRENGRAVVGRGAPRILLAGSPVVFPNWKLPMLIEEMGGVVVIDETCMADRFLYDPVGVSEGSMTEMIRGIAARLIMPCTCPSFSPNEDRMYRLKQLIDKFRVDGVIYHVLKGCMIYDFEVARVEKVMKQAGVPLLRVETDYNPEDVEQLRTRIEAFLEMTGANKREDQCESHGILCRS